MKSSAAERLAANAMDALRSTIHALDEGRPADQTLNALFRANRHWGSRDRRFISHIVFSYFRWRGWLPADRLEPAAAWAYALDASQPHAALTVLARQELPTWHDLPVAGKMAALGAATGLTLSMAMLVPKWFGAALGPDLATRCDEIIASLQIRPPTWIRTRAGQRAGVLAALVRHSAAPRPHDALPCAIACEGGLNLPALRKETGPVFEVQDIASQAVGLACDPRPDQRWWDVCAGSGGKALHLADLMREAGEIIATDVRPTALAQLRRRCADARIRCIRPMGAGQTPTGLFDGVLVDAPCTGIGTWSRNPDMRWRTDAGAVESNAQRQLEILLGAAGFVKPSGTLVYSVCTITQAETLKVVARFLDGRPEFEPSDVNCPAISSSGRSAGDASAPASVTLLPSDGPGDGMFIAKFIRRA